MKPQIKFLHWTPRIICILAILFISLFSLDAFSPYLTLQQQIAAFLMHMIPSFVLIALLLIAWKWELIGGIIFTLIGLGFSPFIFMHNYNMTHNFWHCINVVLIINLPFVIVGILFIISHYKKRDLTSHNS